MDRKPQTVAGTRALRHWPRWLGGVAVVVIVYGPFTLAALGGYLDSSKNLPLVVGLGLLGVTAYITIHLTGRALGLKWDGFRDAFPVQGPIYIWNVGTRLVDLASRPRDAVDQPSSPTSST